MLLRRVIPCLDVDGGRVVKGTQFVDIRDAGDPVELAARYDAEGADEVVFLDITATSSKRDTIVDLDEVRRIAQVVRGRFLYSGGVGSLEDLRALRDLRQVNLAGVIVGKALYEGRFTVAEGQAALDAHRSAPATSRPRTAHHRR